jgi:TonB-linked SusC/RagA family outer membrane protein
MIAIMKQKLRPWRNLFFVLLLCSTFSLIAQQARSQNTKSAITGKVMDENGKPLDGVTIRIKGATVNAISKADGSFSLTAEPNAVLVFTAIGFTTQEVELGGKKSINVTLKSASSILEDVVVVGYGTRKRTEVTGAVASISGDALRQVPTTNLTQALQGRIPGLVVTPSSFRPGAGSSIRLRGNRSLSASNDVLYVVDGFPVSYTIDDMNPADIETVDVLKDAAATAVYGVRGANGVIQITTKKGKVGKMNVTYMGSKSIENIIRPLPIFNGPQIADSWRQAFFADKQYTVNRGTASSTNPLYYYPRALNDIALFWTRFGSSTQWNAIKDAYTWDVYQPTGVGTGTFIARKRATSAEEKALMQALGITTQIDSVDMYDPSKVRSYDWQNEVGLRENGATDNHSISVSAGTDKMKASFNLGYFKQKGIEWGQDYTRYSAGTSVDFKPTKFLNFGTSINFIHSITNTSTGSFGNASGMIPLTVPFDSAGNYILFPNLDQQIVNAFNDRNTVFDETKANRIFGNIYGEVTLFKGFKYRTMFGLDTRNSVRGTFNGAQSSIRLGGLANASQTDNRASSWVYDNIITYNTKIKNDHSINVTLLQELQSLNRASSLTLSGNNLIFEQQKWFSLNRNVDATVTGSGTYTASQYLSYMGRIEYGFKGKYMLTLSTRYDNSSVLSENNNGAWFPSGSVAWQVDREDFFKKQNILTSARIRAGIGVVGNASIDPYQTAGPLAFTNYNWGNGTAAIGSAPTTFATPDLGWEKTTTTNIGIEFSMLKNRITGTIDYYNTNTTDQLQKKTIPATNGVTDVYFNLGKVNNRGIEISLSTANIVKKNFSWSTDFMFSKNKEKIVDIDGTGNDNITNLWFLGNPLQTYWSYQANGIFQYSDTAKGGSLANVYWIKNGTTNAAYQPGKVKIVDVNGDSSFSAAHMVIHGSHVPDFIASINNRFTYKNFDLSFLTYFRVGGLYRVPRPGLVGRYQSNAVNYWTPSNPSNEYQQPTQTSDIPLYWEALTYRKATFIRIKNITLTYRLPQKLTSKMYMNNMSVYISAVNPILIHNGDKNYDPETVPYREFPATTTNQVGPNSYNYKSYVVGVRVDL